MTCRVLLAVIGSAALAIPVAAQSDTWKLDANHSAAQFSVRHLGISTVRGNFTKMSGTAVYDPADPAKSSVDITIEAASVDTRVEMRDKDLKSGNFFDVDKYPTITFKSKRVESAGAGKLKMLGDLTMHGVTKEITLDVDGPSEPMKDARGNQHMGASATAKLNRSDFGMTADAGVVGNEITITIDAEFTKPAASKS
jgi:polyisoprenoid-binding protein YceI